MPQVSRRAILFGSGASLLGTSFGGCVPQQPVSGSAGPVAVNPSPEVPEQRARAAVVEEPVVGTAAYGPVPGERFPVPAAPLSRINPAYLRARVAYASNEKPGTIVVDPGSPSTLSKRAGARCATGWAWARKASPGPASRSSTTSRNGRIGTRP